MDPIKLIVSVGLSLAAGAIGSLATIPNIPSWYAALDKPWFSPPNWVFEPVWTTLYILMGISLYFVWTAPGSKDSKRTAYVLFGIQLGLNALWSIVFFGLHAPLAAVVVIALMLVAILLTAKVFWQHSPTASWLLVPYFAWVSFATCLNLAVAVLN
jgi:tryptophan-rich sensory protein